MFKKILEKIIINKNKSMNCVKKVKIIESWCKYKLEKNKINKQKIYKNLK